MLPSLDKIFTSAAKLNWEKLVISTIFVLILLLGFYGYKKIDSLQFNSPEPKKETPESVFMNQFGSNYMKIDANIHSYLTDLRHRTGADWVLFFGMHNGQNIGPYHLKKVSIIDEALELGNASLYNKMQNIPMTLFSTTYPGFQDAEPVVVRHSDKADPGSMSELSRNGISYEITTGIYIKNFNSPIGFIGLYYQAEKAKKLRDNTERIEENIKHLKHTKERIEYELNRMYLMNRRNE